MPDPAAVNSMFGRIAARYDIANHLLSGGVDFWWRRRLVAAVRRTHPRRIADLATGSGDVAFALRRGLGSGVAIEGLDFCQPMLDEADKKKKADTQFADITFRIGDGLNLPLGDASVDAITIAFGLRNMADRHRALSEMRRVLTPGTGHAFILEFSQPYAWFRPFYYFYLKRILPHLASLFTGDKSAYDYLCGSIEAYPGRPGISSEMEAAGFQNVRAYAFTFGIVALHVGRA